MEPVEIRFDSAESIRAAVGQLYPSGTCPTEIMFVLCDEQDRGFAAAPVDDAPKYATLDECRGGAWTFAGALADACPDGGLFFLIARSAPASVIESDRYWHQAIREACAEQRIRSLGVWLVTESGARELSIEDTMV